MSTFFDLRDKKSATPFLCGCYCLSQIKFTMCDMLYYMLMLFYAFSSKSNGLNLSFVFYFQCGWHFQKYDCAPRFLSPIFHLFSATENSRGKKVKWHKCDFLSITTPGIQFGECCMYLCANWERYNSDTHALYTVWMALTIFVSREFGSIPRALAVANSFNNDENNNSSSKNEQKWGKKKKQQTELCVQLCWWI